MFKTGNFTENPQMAGLRRKLVEELKRKGIHSQRVLEAMNMVPRQLFFPADFAQFVYRDAAFPIGYGQTISQPYTVAYQTELLDLQVGEKVLEIGTGSGYQAAILSALGVELHSVEVVKELLTAARQVLRNIDSSIKLYLGDGSLGLPAVAPFDAILVTAGAPEVPMAYIEQLKTGGRLVIPVGKGKDDQKMMRITRLNGQNTKTEVFGDFKFVPLIGKNGWDV